MLILDTHMTDENQFALVAAGLDVFFRAHMKMKKKKKKEKNKKGGIQA